MSIIKRLALVVVCAALALCWTSSQGYAETTTDISFHGRAQSTAVVRDITGMQYGFMDKNEWVGWKTELQFDLGITPVRDTRPCFRVDKVYLSYRGSYDAIYDLTSRYNAIPDAGRWGATGSRYDLGKDDLRIENDLREAFIDLTWDAGENSAENTMNGHARFGRQIVMWGEADGFNLVNVVNPADNRGVSSFANPDDLAIPIWMARFDVNSGATSLFNNLSFQLLLIPDNRPTLWAPAGAPYGLGLGQNDESSGIGNMQYGMRLGALYNDLQTYFYYFQGFENGNAWNFGTGLIDHPRYKMYGVSIAKPWDAWKAMIRAEASLTDEGSINLDFSSPTFYSRYKMFKAYVGIDKPFHPNLGTDSALSTTVQLFYQHNDDWDFNPAAGRGAIKESSYQIIALASNDYYHGTIAPSIFFWYDIDGSYLFSPAVTYSPDGRWVFKVSATAFLGDPNSHSKFAGYIGGNDEFAFNIKYQW
jgi:hypothetical protein